MLRRKFLKKTSLWLASIGAALAGFSLFRQLYPQGAGQGKRVKVGKPSDFPVDTYTLVEDLNIFIYRDHEGIKAVSAECTHLGCTLQRTLDGFECPCHGSCYSDRGEVLAGPAPRDLPWCSIEKALDGNIVVDLGHHVNPDFKYILA